MGWVRRAGVDSILMIRHPAFQFGQTRVTPPEKMLGASPVQSGAMPLSASSFMAFGFLPRWVSPMPRSTLGALENWMLS
jgi:hypothetical protein